MKKILMDAADGLDRVAVVEDGRLTDLVVERWDGVSTVGNIYLGQVKNILPSQFAFIDVGQEKNGFLNMADKTEKTDFKMGQSVLVQVRKDPTGEKGANLSTRLNFTGRMAVLFESGEGEAGVSQKIRDVGEKKRLKEIARSHAPMGCGLILRTGSENKSEEEIGAEINKLWEAYAYVTEMGKHYKAPALVYAENSLWRELLRHDVEEIVVNAPAKCEEVRKEAESCIAGYGVRVQLYGEDVPLFEAHGIERQIERALAKKVWLDCGGFLIVEQTEACVIIDVNTGKFTGKKNLRQSILKTNLEAAGEVALQMRLRNLSGMIIIDFIDMAEEEDKKTLYETFSREIDKDRIKANIVGMTELGLMQVTRKKTREPIERILFTECPLCHGRGHVRT